MRHFAGVATLVREITPWLVLLSDPAISTGNSSAQTWSKDAAESPIAVEISLCRFGHGRGGNQPLRRRVFVSAFRRRTLASWFAPRSAVALTTTDPFTLIPLLQMMAESLATIPSRGPMPLVRYAVRCRPLRPGVGAERPECREGVRLDADTVQGCGLAYSWLNDSPL